MAWDPYDPEYDIQTGGDFYPQQFPMLYSHGGLTPPAPSYGPETEEQAQYNYDPFAIESPYFEGPGPQFPVDEMQRVQQQYKPGTAPEAPPLTMGDFFGQMVGNLQVPRIRSRTPGRRGDIETILGGIGSSLLEGAAQGYGKMRQQGREQRLTKMMNVWKEQEAQKQADRDLQLKGLEKGYDTKRNEFVAGRTEFQRQRREYYEQRRQDARDAARTARERKLDADRQRASDARFNLLASQLERQGQNHLRGAIGQLRRSMSSDRGINEYMDIRGNLLTATEQVKKANELDERDRLGAGAADVLLTYALMRVAEPGNQNVVKEGEFKVASKAVGQFQDLKLKAQLKQFLRGDRFTPEGRRAILEIIRTQAKSRRPTFDESVNRLRGEAVLFGLSPEQADLAVPTFKDDDAMINPERTPLILDYGRGAGAGAGRTPLIPVGGAK